MNENQLGKRKYLKKTRRITSCSECYRRKTKVRLQVDKSINVLLTAALCDRQRPCRPCTSRGKSERCTYGTSSSPQPLQSPVSNKSVENNISPPIVDQSSLTVVESGLGYVNTDESSMLLTPMTSAPTHGRSHSHQQASTKVPHAVNGTIIQLLDLTPEPSLTRKFVDVFFSQANWYFSVLDRCFFDQGFRDFWIWHQKTNREIVSYETCGFAALQLQIVAIALHFLPQTDRLDENVKLFTQSDLDGKSQACSEAGDSIFSILKHRQPSLSSIEADIMRCAWLKNSGHGLDAWHSLNNAVRQAQDLKLHLEPTSHTIEDTTSEHLSDSWHCEHKRRIWACLLAWDAHMALQLGRPRMINLADCTVRRPTVCDCPKDISRTLLRPSDDSTGSPAHYMSHMVKYELALLIHRAMDSVSFDTERAKTEVVVSIHNEVTQMLLRLPPAFQKANPDTSWDILDPCIPKLRLQIQVIVESFLLALHRPYAFANRDSLKAAVDAARAVLDKSQELFEMVQENQYKTFTLVFYTIDAGIFLAATLLGLRTSGNESYITPQLVTDTLEKAIKRLHFLERFHTVAVAGKCILENCLVQFKATEQGSANIRTTPASEVVDSSAADNTGTSAFWPYSVDDEDQFWNDLIKDAGSTTAWLDNYLEAYVPDFDESAINISLYELSTV